MKRIGCALGAMVLIFPLVFTGLMMIGAAGGATTRACTPGAARSDLPASVGSWKGDQIVVAAAIIDEGASIAVSERGILIALMTAMQESRLRNLPYGDRDSVNPFQQRPSQGWGTREELLNLTYAVSAFYGGPTGPNADDGDPPGLLDISGWENMGLGQAAQAVQRSAYPDLYDPWEADARTLLSALGTEGNCVDGEGSNEIVAQAEKWLGTPYSWGGGTLNGPSYGFGAGQNVLGFDCSSLSRYAVHHGAGITIDRTAAAQESSKQGHLLFEDLPPGKATMNEAIRILQPGDLVFMSRCTGTACGAHHVVIYKGNGQVVHAPKTGDVVKVTPLNVWSNKYLTAKRYS